MEADRVVTQVLLQVNHRPQWLERPEGTVPELEDVDRGRSGHLAASLLASGER